MPPTDLRSHRSPAIGRPVAIAAVIVAWLVIPAVADVCDPIETFADDLVPAVNLGDLDVVGLDNPDAVDVKAPRQRTADRAAARARAIELGVNDYLGKPYQDAELLDAIGRLLEERGITLS